MFTLHNGSELVKFLIRDGWLLDSSCRAEMSRFNLFGGLTEKSRTAKIINGFTLAQHICVLSATDSGQILLSIFFEKYVGSKKFSTLIIKVDFCKRVQNVLKRIERYCFKNTWQIKIGPETCTPGPYLMRIHLVWYSTSARYEKYSNIHLVRPIIHLVQIFALSTSWINQH